MLNTLWIERKKSSKWFFW